MGFQRPFKGVSLEGWYGRTNLAVSGNEGTDAIIGGSDEWFAIFDGSHSGDLEMLFWSNGLSKPGVVAQGEKEVGASG